MKTATVMFACGACGLMTPGAFEYPEHVEPNRPITLTQDCLHCDEPMERRFGSPAELWAAVEPDEERPQQATVPIEGGHVIGLSNGGRCIHCGEHTERIRSHGYSCEEFRRQHGKA